MMRMTSAGEGVEKGRPFALLAGMQTGAATVESSTQTPQKIKNGSAFRPSDPVTKEQFGSCCLLPPSRQNSRGKDLVIKERSLYSKASQFWNKGFPLALVT